MNTILCLAALGALLELTSAAKCSVNYTNDVNKDYAKYLECYYPNYKPDNAHAERFGMFSRCYNEYHSVERDGHYYKEIQRVCNRGWLFSEQTTNNTNAAAKKHVVDSSKKLPESVNWVTKKAVTSVKDQEECGSSYAFAAVAALEGAYAIKTGKLVDFSAQQYIDCSYQVLKNGHNMGCKGGSINTAWLYNGDKAQTALAQSCYPYTSDKTKKNGKCMDKANCATKAVVSGYKVVDNKVASVMHAVATVGPLACNICIKNILTYKSGIVSSDCSPISHAATIVGYGNQKGKDYWLVKNSWGDDWGQDGYIKLERKQSNGKVGAQGLSNCMYPILA